MPDDLRPPYRIQLDNARDPYTARNALGITAAALGAVPATRTITAGAGLTGGGDLSANRTIDVGAGTGITVNANDVALTVPVSVANGGTGSTTVGGGPFVQKAGDTMTGDLTVTTPTTASIILHPSSGSSTGTQLYHNADAFRIATQGGANRISLDHATGIWDFPISPTAVTPAAGDASSKVATTAFVSTIGTYQSATGSTGLSAVTGGNAATLSLSAGDWLVWGVVLFTGAGSTTVAYARAAVSSSSGFITGSFCQDLYLANVAYFGAVNGSGFSIAAPMQRFSFGGTTNVYLVALANFGTSTMSAAGSIYAVRVK